MRVPDGVAECARRGGKDERSRARERQDEQGGASHGCQRVCLIESVPAQVSVSLQS